MRRRALLAVVVFAVSPAAAQTYSTADGAEYELVCNTAGYVLTPFDRSLAPLYLGKSCDAVAGEYSGTWCWANGGFVADFGDLAVEFPRQELICNPAPDYVENCRC
jgi:hypothetical protein